MKVGDLVQLSAYGEARSQNYSARGGFGIVTKFHGHRLQYPWSVLWYYRHGGECPMSFHKRELKKYKPDKK